MSCLGPYQMHPIKQVSHCPCPIVALSCFMYMYLCTCINICIQYAHAHTLEYLTSVCIVDSSSKEKKNIAAAWRQGKNNLVAMQHLYYLILRCNILSIHNGITFLLWMRTLYPGLGIYMIRFRNILVLGSMFVT